MYCKFIYVILTFVGYCDFCVLKLICIVQSNFQFLLVVWCYNTSTHKSNVFDILCQECFVQESSLKRHYTRLYHR